MSNEYQPKRYVIEDLKGNMETLRKEFKENRRQYELHRDSLSDDARKHEETLFNIERCIFGIRKNSISDWTRRIKCCGRNFDSISRLLAHTHMHDNVILPFAEGPIIRESAFNVGPAPDHSGLFSLPGVPESCSVPELEGVEKGSEMQVADELGITPVKRGKRKVTPQAVSLKKYKCEEPGCVKVYTSAYGLKYHSQKGHVRVSSQERKPYTCAVEGCGKQYKNSNGLKYHTAHYHN